MKGMKFKKIGIEVYTKNRVELETRRDVLTEIINTLNEELKKVNEKIDECELFGYDMTDEEYENEVVADCFLD